MSLRAGSAGRLARSTPDITGALAATSRRAGFSEASLATCHRADAPPVSGGAPRRFAWPRDPRALTAALLADAVQVVDALQLARPKQTLCVSACVEPCIPPPPPGVIRDSSTLLRLREPIVQSLPCPVEVKPRDALRDLLRTDDVYELGSGTTVLPFAEEHLKLASRPLGPKDIATLCSSSASAMISDPFRWIVKSEQEALADADSSRDIRPYWDPLLRASRSHMLRFLMILHRSKLLAWRVVV